MFLGNEYRKKTNCNLTNTRARRKSGRWMKQKNEKPRHPLYTCTSYIKWVAEASDFYFLAIRTARYSNRKFNYPLWYERRGTTTGRPRRVIWRRRCRARNCWILYVRATDNNVSAAAMVGGGRFDRNSRVRKSPARRRGEGSHVEFGRSFACLCTYT